MEGGLFNGGGSGGGAGRGGGGSFSDPYTNNGAMASEDTLPKIHDALRVVYDPHSTNQARQEAQAFLENVKALGQAPAIGFDLASSSTNPPVVRHYGLSLLEDAITHKWATYTPEQAVSLRGLVLDLAAKVSADDALFLRNKVALLWVEVAKRCWAGEWVDMDEMLLRLWRIPGINVHKELVLYILEILSYDMFSADDVVVAVRGAVLYRATIEIFVPANMRDEMLPNRQGVPEVRSGEEGWLNRVSEFLRECLSSDLQNNERVRACAIRSLALLSSLVTWILPKAVLASGCVGHMCNGLAVPNVAVQKAALEALHALYSRSYFPDDEFAEAVWPMFDSKFVDLGRRLFQWSTVDAEDIDDDKYQFAKKFSEMLASIGNYLERKFSSLPSDVNVLGFLELLLEVVQSQSLVVSIPVLVTWTRLLNNRAIGSSIGNTPLVGPLLEVCSSRLIRYENLPEDTQDPSYLFLVEDTDTIPERHAFLGNYRRYSCQAIESIVQLKLVDAFRHILGQAESVLQHLYDNGQSLDVANYVKYSMPVLRVDAQFTVIESALRGYVKWRAVVSSEPTDSGNQQKAALEAEFESYCNRLLEMKMEDPSIRKRILQLLVAFSTTALDKNAGFMLKVLEHILMTWPTPQQPEHRHFNDAIKDLQSESMVELQRLATKMPDHLLDVYDQLEAKVNEMIASGTLDEKRQIAYQSFLFIVIHRATRIDPTTRMRRLQAFIDPVTAQWESPDLKRALSTYSGFTELMALDKAQSYLARKPIQKIADWGSVELDAEGLALQAELEERQTMLPLRSTKSFLTYSVEKVERESPPYLASCVLWKAQFPIILPQLLQFLSHAHASHNPNNWTALPPEMLSIAGRVLTDRFWQAGISEGSKDDFYARVVEKKGTLEGLASSIRGSIRFVRETCYAIIYCMSRLDLQFYGFEELPGPLAHALFADSFSLSTHQIINLLNLVRYLVDHCPVELRDHFLPPILAVCFQQMDAKIKSEWDKLDQQQEVNLAGDALTEEMKAESILRQLTYTAVVMVADFLDPARTNASSQTESSSAESQQTADKYPSLRKFCLTKANVFEPLLLFCAHAIRMHDGRCCGVVLRVFRSIVPEFQDPLPPQPPAAPNAGSGDQLDSEGGLASRRQHAARELFQVPSETAGAIREFISSEVLKACITSLHEPYFVDLQKDLASLIASILVNYSPLSSTPRDVLLSLPNMKPAEVDRAIEFLCRPGMHSRQQRAIVLDLLKDLKGVRISEMGKLNRASGLRAETRRPVKKGPRTKMAQEFMTPVPGLGSSAGGVGGGAAGQGMEGGRQSPDLEGVGDLFNQAG